MGTGAAPGSKTNIWLGVALLAAGLAGHLLSAQAIGGHHIAYRDHIAGFVLLAVVSGPLIALLGRRFWRGRADITWLVIGAVQAILGLLVWTQRYNIH